VRDPTGHELNHRVKKTLSIVQGLALLTRRHTKTLLEFTRSFEASLVALAKPHYILSRVNAAPVSCPQSACRLRGSARC
jgi:two-component sensor histidine kinase